MLALLLACTSPPERASNESQESGSTAASTLTGSPGPARPAQTVELPEAPPALPSEDLEPAADGFELISAGAEPRAALRFTPREGTARASLSTAMRVSVTGTGMPPMQQDLAPVERLVTAELVSASDQRIELLVGFAELDQRLGLDPRGRVLARTSEAPPTTTPQQRKTLETVAQNLTPLLVELPEAAVGIGGEWKATRPVTIGGLELVQTNEIRLVSLDGQRATFEVRLSQRPRLEQFTPPGQDTPLDLADFDGKGAAWIVYDLGSMLPLGLTASLTTKFTAATPTEPRRELDFDLGVELRLVPDHATE